MRVPVTGGIILLCTTTEFHTPRTGYTPAPLCYLPNIFKASTLWSRGASLLCFSGLSGLRALGVTYAAAGLPTPPPCFDTIISPLFYLEDMITHLPHELKLQVPCSRRPCKGSGKCYLLLDQGAADRAVGN